MFNLLNNTFNANKEINKFTKEEILEIKKIILKFESNGTTDSEIENYLKSKLEYSPNIIELYSNYLNELKRFLDSYIIPAENVLYVHLKSDILNEVNLIIKNLESITSNSNNIKRILKNKTLLDKFSLELSKPLGQSQDISSYLKKQIKEINEPYKDEIFLWIESNKIKNLNFKLNDLPSNLENWNEMKDLVIFIQSLNDVFPKKRKDQKKDNVLSFHFVDLYSYYLSKKDVNVETYSDLIHLLYINKVFEEYQGDEFINILERKEIIQNLKDFTRPLIKAFTLNVLKEVLDEIENFYREDTKFNLKNVLEEKINVFLPNIVGYYITGLEKKFQETVNELDETKEFEEITNQYYDKIENFASIIDKVEDWILKLENYLRPYENITNSFKKTLSSVASEIFRRKNEYLNFIQTIKNEEMRIDVRKFVTKKISELNDMIQSYEDETSLIIKEEFPQLKQIREILIQYDEKIKIIKEEVFKKIESVKSNDIDLYQIIKLWEENFNRKRQQLAFLISLLLNKLFKSFKELIEKEGLLFATITEITSQTENFEELPLNFALSSFLADKLTENELRERISEINAKINHLNHSLGLYQVELSKLEKILSTRVKKREGIEKSDVQCTICHKYINFVKDQVITCPFCASTYHYLCVAFWLSKYNSCPMCQNHFLEPYSDLFEKGEE
jgi:hypothetical protein